MCEPGWPQTHIRYDDTFSIASLLSTALDVYWFLNLYTFFFFFFHFWSTKSLEIWLKFSLSVVFGKTSNFITLIHFSFSFLFVLPSLIFPLPSFHSFTIIITSRAQFLMPPLLEAPLPHLLLLPTPNHSSFSVQKKADLPRISTKQSIASCSESRLLPS